MGKTVDDTVLDGALDILKNNVVSISVCTAEPTTRTEAAVTNMLATKTISGTDFTHANGDTSGRKTTIAQQSTISISNTGTALHVALFDASVLRYVTTCTSQALTSGGTVTIPAWKIEVADPT